MVKIVCVLVVLKNDIIVKKLTIILVALSRSNTCSHNNLSSSLSKSARKTSIGNICGTECMTDERI